MSHTIIPPTLRPDGSLRKPVRIRAGYVPQEEVPAWETPAKRIQKERALVGVPGWDDTYGTSKATTTTISTTSEASKPLTQAQKRNMRRKKKGEQKAVNELAADLTQKAKISAKTPAPKSEKPKSVQPPVEITYDQYDNLSEEELMKKIKAVQKKLRQIVALQEKVKSGELKPAPDQLAKLKKKDQLENELKYLQSRTKTEEM